MAPKLTPARREEYRKQAWQLSGQGLHNTEIAEEIGVNRNTVGSLLEEEKQLRRALFPDADVEAVKTYTAVIRRAWQSFVSFSADTRAQNAVGFLNTIVNAQKAIDDVTGAKAPVKREESIDISYRDYTTGDDLEDLFQAIDDYRAQEAFDEEDSEAHL